MVRTGEPSGLNLLLGASLYLTCFVLLGPSIEESDHASLSQPNMKYFSVSFLCFVWKLIKENSLSLAPT